MSEKSENKTLSFRNRCGLFQVKALLSRPKNVVASDPSEVTQKMSSDPESEVSEDRLMKDIIK